MEESSSNGSLVEIREEDMVSPLGGGENPFRRTAHFLKPSLKRIKNPARDFLPKTLFSETPISKPEKLPLEAAFNGWLNPIKGWKAWEEHLRPKYEHIWESVGIDEAIKASTCEIQRNNGLILGLAQKWYFKTNTFVFSWGEATITLEDIMICGGFSVVGAPIFALLEDKESKELERKLNEVRSKFVKSRARRADHHPWLKHFFMKEKGDDDDDEELEHAAFLSLWLSRFVFPGSISKQIFPIAIRLARGTRIALAPAVLASIYRDLRLLKRSIDDAMKLGASGNDGDSGISTITITLRAPLKLVQLWAFERFPTLHPPPNLIEYNQPRIVKWHKVKMINQNHRENYYVTLSLDSCGQSFKWRPYGWVWFSTTCNAHNKDYLESFARCLRHSELVGVEQDNHFIENYLPHRVGMQFGLDQDIPGKLDFCKDISPKIAWTNYNKPITDKMLLDAAIASSSILEPSVTCKYLEWWKQSKLGLEEKSSKDSELRSLSHRDQAGGSDEEDGLTIKGILRSHCDRSFGNDETNHVHPLPVAEADKKGVSMADGIENLANRENVNIVARGLKRNRGNAKSEDVIGESKRANEGIINTCTRDIVFSDLETRIGKLERNIAKLKAEKYGAKAGLSCP